MSRAIRCLVFVAILASIGQGRVIEKRSPGVTSDVSKHIDTAIDAVGDFGSDAIDEITDFANSHEVRRVGNKFVDVANDVGDTFDDIGDFFGRKKRSPGVADFAGQIDEAVDLKALGGHVDTAIDAVGDFGSDAIDEITDFANSDEVRRAGNKVVDVANDVRDAFEDAFDDAGSAIKDIFGRKKRSPGVADFAGQIDEAVDLKAIGGHVDTVIDAVGDFGSDAIDEITDFANSDEVRRAGNKVVDVANDAFDDARSAIGDFLGGLGRKKRSYGDPEEDLGAGSDIWDRIDKGVAAVGNFPPKVVFGSGGYTETETFGSFKNLILEETRAYAAKALGKYYGNLLYKSFT